MNVALIRYTPAPDELAMLAASVCTNKEPSERGMTTAVGSGHESILEHASFTFLAENISRVLLAQLTRHRIASFSVESQRYVNYEDGFGYIIPPSIADLGAEAVKRYEAQMEMIHHWYCGWVNCLGKEKQEAAPLTFADAGPGCMRGACPEKRPCGKPRAGA